MKYELEHRRTGKITEISGDSYEELIVKAAGVGYKQGKKRADATAMYAGAIIATAVIFTASSIDKIKNNEKVKNLKLKKKVSNVLNKLSKKLDEE